MKITEGLERLLEKQTREIEMDLERQGKSVQQFRKRRKQQLRHIVATQES